MTFQQPLKHIAIFVTAFLTVQIGLYSFRGIGNETSIAALSPFERSPVGGQESIDIGSHQVRANEIAPPVAEKTPTTESAPSGDITAAAAFSAQIVDGQSAPLYTLNADKELPIASLTKLMTALVVFEQHPLVDTISISADAMRQEGEQGNLQQGQVLTVKDLLYILLIESSNRAAYALAEKIGVDPFIIAMNERAAALGLAHTHFVDSSGLEAGSYSTAADIAKLTQYLLQTYPLFGEMIGLREYHVYLADGSLHHTVTTTNQLLGYYGITGGKTGYTDIAKGCFMAIQKRAEGYGIHVILGAEDRFLEMQKLIRL